MRETENAKEGVARITALKESRDRLVRAVAERQGVVAGELDPSVARLSGLVEGLRAKKAAALARIAARKRQAEEVLSIWTADANEITNLITQCSKYPFVFPLFCPAFPLFCPALLTI